MPSAAVWADFGRLGQRSPHVAAWRYDCPRRAVARSLRPRADGLAPHRPPARRAPRTMRASCAPRAPCTTPTSPSEALPAQRRSARGPHAGQRRPLRATARPSLTAASPRRPRPPSRATLTGGQGREERLRALRNVLSHFCAHLLLWAPRRPAPRRVPEALALRTAPPPCAASFKHLCPGCYPPSASRDVFLACARAVPPARAAVVQLFMSISRSPFR